MIDDNRFHIDPDEEEGLLPPGIEDIPEDDPDFADAGVADDSASGQDGEQDEDLESFSPMAGNPIVRFLEMIGYYDPSKRKMILLAVVALTAFVSLLLLDSVKQGGKVVVEGLPTAQEQAPVQQGIGFGEERDDLSNESMTAVDEAVRRTSGPGTMAAQMFEYEPEMQDDTPPANGADMMSVAPDQKAKTTVTPVSSSEAAAARREKALQELGITQPEQAAAQTPAQSPSQPSLVPSSAPTAAERIQQTYGISAEALAKSGLTPEQFEQIIGTMGEPTKDINTLLSDASQGQTAVSADNVQQPPVTVPDERIPVQSTPIRKSTGMNSLDSDNWGSMGGMTSLEDMDPFVSTDDTHPFKVMFCRTEKIHSGQRVSLRLLEDMVVDNTLLQANTHLNAICTVGERLSISVSSIEINGRIYSLDFIGYDNDGGAGLYCPQTNAQQKIRDGERQGGMLGASAIQSGITGSLAGQVVSAGASMVMSGSGNTTVTLTSGYTFYLLRKRQ